MPLSRPLFLTNTYGRVLEEFRPLREREVTVYTCGPTVYSYAHLGNFRAFIFADTLRRVLQYNGYGVTQVRNITDVGHLTDDTLSTGLDKIEAAARSQNASPWDIARHVTGVFLRDAELLNIETPEYMPRATEYIEAMIDLVQLLIERGHAYAVNGDVYYDVSTFPRYGALSGNSIDDLIAGHRVEIGEGKRSPADFAVWRAAEPDKIMRWSSPWGDGVPGWHLECSAMAIRLLGPEIDIHTGGEDHIFPHHEDEIAQSEGATGLRFARYWLHNGWLQIGSDEKMSKSQGNVLTVSDVVDRGIEPLAFRYFTFQAHYRTPLNFSWDAVWAARTALVRIWEAVSELVQSASAEPLGADACELQRAFHEAINRDLDMPVALAQLHQVLGSRLAAGEKLSLVEDMDRVLGLRLVETARTLSKASDEETRLLHERAAARANKNWVLADELRAALSERGLDVKDTAAGQRWVRRDTLAATRDQHSEEHSG